MRRDELLTRINFDIIDYLNEPFNNGTRAELESAILTLYEVVKENIEWYADHYDGAELTLDWK